MSSMRFMAAPACWPESLTYLSYKCKITHFDVPFDIQTLSTSPGNADQVREMHLDLDMDLSACYFDIDIMSNVYALIFPSASGLTCLTLRMRENGDVNSLASHLPSMPNLSVLGINTCTPDDRLNAICSQAHKAHELIFRGSNTVLVSGASCLRCVKPWTIRWDRPFSLDQSVCCNGIDHGG